ncbi:MAG: endonuclease/exonuclease/phosphatase family protein [Saprospiraceae bacterium]|nr:endonuclease/exonuclease/phosphatase family protein [Saprospiraceae bacterium]
MSTRWTSGSSAWQWAVVGLIIAVSIIFLFPPDLLIAKLFSSYAVHWMLFCLLAGIVSLFMGYERLLYTCFICTGVLAFYLMNSFNTDLKFSKLSRPNSIQVLFANPTLSTDRLDETMEHLLGQGADLIILEEFTPVGVELATHGRSDYPHQYLLPRADTQGKGVLSKLPLIGARQQEWMGNLVVDFGVTIPGSDTLHVCISTHLPPITMDGYRKLGSFLDTLAGELSRTTSRQLLVANFNLVPWSRELRNFRRLSGLKASRRDNADAGQANSPIDILNAPNFELMYSNDLECTGYSTVVDSSGKTIGLVGRYQHKFGF